MSTDSPESQAPRIHFRPETPEDRAWLLALYAESRRDELDAAGFPEPLRQPFIEQQFEARHTAYRAAFRDAEWSVLCIHGNPAGRWIVHRISQELRIVDLALRPEYRGQRLGTRLLQQLQQEARETRRPVRLQVLPENPAVRLYLRLGFIITSQENFRLQMEWNPPAPNPTAP